MPIETLSTSTKDLNVERVSSLIEDLIKVFQHHKPTVKEIILAYGNLGYTLGACIDNWKNKGPDERTLLRLHKEKPSVGSALMLQGIQVCTWAEGDLSAREDIEEEKEETIK